MNGKLPYDYLMQILVEQDKTFMKKIVLDLMPELSLPELFEIQELNYDLIKEHATR